MTRMVRPQSVAEELANSASHGVACLAALAAGTVLLFSGTRPPSDNHVGVVIFAATMVLVYFCSALYHGFPPGRAKTLFMKLDQGAIFLFIAGTYTPFSLKAHQSPAGWALLVAIWALALCGLALQLGGHLPRSVFSTGGYLLLGWSAILAAGPILAQLPPPGQAWLVGGGIVYTAGMLFYVYDSRMRFAHFVWHLLAIAGTACHWLAVARYAT